MKEKEISDPELRKFFDREYIINSDWYKERLELKQRKDLQFYTKQINYLEEFVSNPSNVDIMSEMNIEDRLVKVKTKFEEASSQKYIESLIGTIGSDPLFIK
jgi:hypothetical protein